MQLNEYNQTKYTVVSTQFIQRLDATMTLLKHDATNAQVMVVETKDDNKVFSITFKTLPIDSSGVAHIIEHSVLCGSTKYPVKDPFIELAKGSLNTFTNAMTFPDKTIYPIASCNLQDYKNAMAIYCDAVFHPLMLQNEMIFQQEGWHYEFDDQNHLTINGVVYNEMNGVFSSIEDCINEYIMASLFPDNCYGVCSGGDPDVIPTLSYDEFKRFHGIYYHPSNARFFLYGDCDMNERLKWLDQEVLNGYTTLNVDDQIPLQKGFDHRYTMVIPYNVESNVDQEYYYAYNIGFDHELNQKEIVAYRIITHALFNGNGAPLRKALNQAKLGSDMMAYLVDGIQQPYISIVVKHARKEDQDAIVQTIESVIENAMKDGGDQEKLLGGLNTIRFGYIEGSSGIPYGLAMNLSILDNWLYDKDPYEPIQLESSFDQLKAEIESDGLTNMIQQAFKDNTYRSLVVMEPTVGLAQTKAEQLNTKLQTILSGLTKEQVDELKKQTQALKVFQQSENDPKDVAKLPTLTRNDLDDHIRPSNLTKTTVDGYPLAYTTHHQCGDIVYLSMMIDLNGMDEDDLTIAALVSRLWTRLSTTKYGYDQLENKIMLDGGGISIGMDLLNKNQNKDFDLVFMVNAKCFIDQLDGYTKLIHEILTHTVFDYQRIGEVVDEIVSDLAAALQGSAHVYAINKAFSNLSIAYQIKESLSGLTFYEYVKTIQQWFKSNDEDAISHMIESMQTLVEQWLSHDRIKFDLVVSPFNVDQMINTMEMVLPSLQWFEPMDHPLVNYQFKPGCNMAYTTNGHINYAAYATKIHLFDNIGIWQVFVNVMNYDYLWNQIRVLGGAYGQFALLTRSGMLGYVSYRDPHIANTYAVYDHVTDYLNQLDFDDDTMLKFIIGTIATLDAPQSPARFGASCYLNDLNGISDAKRLKEKQDVLACTVNDLKQLAKSIESAPSWYRCVIGSKTMIEKDKVLFDVVEPLL